MEDVIPINSVFTITTGEYSDYLVRGVFRAVAELNTKDLTGQFIEEFPEQAEIYKFSESKFMAWLVRKNLVEDVDSFEWHLYDYIYSTSEMTLEKFTREDDV